MHKEHVSNACAEHQDVDGTTEGAFVQAWQEQVGKMPWLASRLLPNSRKLLKRFQHFYDKLCQLPRPARRRWQRKLSASLAAVAFILALSNTPMAFALPISGDASLNGVECFLADAIIAANTDTASGDCVAGTSGADTITLLGDVTLYSVDNGTSPSTNGLPTITSEITIEGDGYTIARDDSAPNFRILNIADSGTLTLNAITISNGALDSGANGAGIANLGTLTLNNSTISGNSGDGIHNGYFSMATVNKSTISGNSGAGINGDFSTIKVNNSTVSGNSGGGLRNNMSGELYLTSSTVSGNSTSLAGGGIYNAGTLTIAYTLVSGNTATSGAQEVYQIAPCATSAAVSAPDCLTGLNMPPAVATNIFGHSGLTNAQALSGVTLPASAITATSDGTTPTALADILETTLADNGGPTLTHALPIGSPAIDAADDGAFDTDQRGVIRPQGTADDIGAFEALLPEKINSQLAQISFGKVSSTTTPDATYPSQSTAGVLNARMVLRNNGGPVSDIYYQVTTLSNGNYLLNADGAPGQIGSKLSVVNGALPGGNSSWDQPEDLSQDFKIGVMVAAGFQFRVDVYGVIAATPTVSSAPAAELLGSYLLELDPTLVDGGDFTIYVPAVNR